MYWERIFAEHKIYKNCISCMQSDKKHSKLPENTWYACTCRYNSSRCIYQYILYRLTVLQQENTLSSAPIAKFHTSEDMSNPIFRYNYVSEGLLIKIRHIHVVYEHNV